MSCYCEKYGSEEQPAGCPCDQFIHPPELRIPAGLNQLPRQIALFGEYRRAMLADVRNHVALADWRARESDDLGVMLLEMWSYLCDNLSFYDEVISQELYIRTSQRRPSLRKLVGLLGYLPRPAVASTVSLAAMATGRRTVFLPEGTALRSSAFDGEAPQKFELLDAMEVHPLTNKWDIQEIHHGTLPADNPDSLLIQPEAEILEQSLLFIHHLTDDSMNQAAHVQSVERISGEDGKTYTRVSFMNALDLPSGTLLADLRLQITTQIARLWTTGSSPNAISTSGGRSKVVLDKLYQNIKANDLILISREEKDRWYGLTEVKEVQRSPTPDNTITINSNTFELAAIKIPVTRITLDTKINNSSRKGSDPDNWNNSTSDELVIHYGMVAAGKVVDEAKTTLNPSDSLGLNGLVEKPIDTYHPETFMLQDKNLLAVKIEGSVDFDAKELKPDQGQEAAWEYPLTFPVEAYGNVVLATRGESVKEEILGSGDASVPNQSFKLKKKPLTYYHGPVADNDQGVISSLKVFVDGVQWEEVQSFFGQNSDNPVFMVRQDDADDSFVTFGDGIRGQRLTTGIDNIVADYRFGAGKASPPAGAVTQIDKPVKDLQSIKNPLPASGGENAEEAEKIRTYAPRSILTLGRAVSIQDMEAVALSVPGVRVAQAEWYWDGARQRALVRIWYIGETGIGATVKTQLRNMTDPSTPIQVSTAQAMPTSLSADISIDPRYRSEDVITELSEILVGTGDGFLLPEKQLIGKPLFRSTLFKVILMVPGAVAVRGIQWNDLQFLEFAKTPGTGKYFDFEQGTITLNGKSF